MYAYRNLFWPINVGSTYACYRMFDPSFQPRISLVSASDVQWSSSLVRLVFSPSKWLENYIVVILCLLLLDVERTLFQIWVLIHLHASIINATNVVLYCFLQLTSLCVCREAVEGFNVCVAKWHTIAPNETTRYIRLMEYQTYMNPLVWAFFVFFSFFILVRFSLFSCFCLAATTPSMR